MSSINKVMLLGRLGKEPEIRDVNGQKVANFSLATSERYTDKRTGEKKEITEWSNVTLWGKPAEIVAQYVHKGHLLYVEGKLRTRKWTDQSGVERWTTEILAHTIELMPNEKAPSQAGPSTYTPPPTEADPFAGPNYEKSNDDLPF